MPEHKVVITSTPDTISDNMFCQCIMGMSLDALVRDIKTNKNGKYNDLYEKQSA